MEENVKGVEVNRDQLRRRRELPRNLGFPPFSYIIHIKPAVAVGVFHLFGFSMPVFHQLLSKVYNKTSGEFHPFSQIH